MEELAKLLGTTKEKLESLADEMGEFTGKKGIPDQLLEKIKTERQEALRQLGLTENSSRKEILAALANRVGLLEEDAKKVLGEPEMQNHEYIRRLFARAGEIVTASGGTPLKAVARPKKGFFLKEEKAKEFFRQNPPQNILAQRGCANVDELFEREDLFEAYSALRFLEDRKWQNEVFFAPFSKLTPDDFEERPIVMRVLDPKKWGSEARNFTKKKFHNTTHLKELGVVIVIPVDYTEGALTRMFSMMFHYLNEVAFYAKYFASIAGESSPDGTVGASFAKKFVSALRGDIRDSVPDLENIVSWVIMPRYLAKENPNDLRLTIPHISPEALHWARAADNLAALADHTSGLPTDLSAEALAKGEALAKAGLSFWKGKAHIGGFFADNASSAAGGTSLDGSLVSFNFEDNVFSLAAGELSPAAGGQYTYHVREALWNRFFTEWFDREDVLETLMIEDFGQGFVGFKIRSTPESEDQKS